MIAVEFSEGSVVSVEYLTQLATYRLTEMFLLET